jgi:hypothetical protein
MIEDIGRVVRVADDQAFMRLSGVLPAPSVGFRRLKNWPQVEKLSLRHITWQEQRVETELRFRSGQEHT